MKEEGVVLIVVAVGVAAVVIAILLLSGRRTRSLRDLLRDLAASAGWTDLRGVFMAAAGVQGRWRSFPVSLKYHARYKGVPQRLILTVKANNDSRMTLKRKFTGIFSNHPLTWFGLPVIEVRQPGAEGLWVRAAEPMLADRIFSDQGLASMIQENMVARFDEIKVDRRGLRITRSLDDRPVREKYGIPQFQMRFDSTRFEPIAREELALAEALVQKLGVVGA